MVHLPAAHIRLFDFLARCPLDGEIHVRAHIKTLANIAAAWNFFALGNDSADRLLLLLTHDFQILGHAVDDRLQFINALAELGPASLRQRRKIDILPAAILTGTAKPASFSDRFAKRSNRPSAWPVLGSMHI